MLPIHAVSLSSFRASRYMYSDSDELESSESSLNGQGLLYTQMLLLDYKQFKAARLIQSQVRGFLVRSRIRRWNRAARILAQAWRKFIAKRKLMVSVEVQLQYVVIASFDAASVRIQAFFRGYWSRKHINNMIKLKNIQQQYLEEILTYYAQRLHTIMKNAELPGYVSLWNDPDYSKMHDLLKILSYRLYNRYIRRRHLMSHGLTLQFKRSFLDSTHYTPVPYSGFNDSGKCFTRAAVDDKMPKYYEPHEYDVAQTFMKAELLIYARKHSPSSHKEKVYHNKHIMEVECFCKDLIESMKHWHACPVLNRVTKKNLREYLENAQHCLEEISILPSCSCKRDDPRFDDITCD